MNSTHCGRSTEKPGKNSYPRGLIIYMCMRCNYTQIDLGNMTSHLEKQHNTDAIKNMEYREISLMAPLKNIPDQSNNDENFAGNMSAVISGSDSD